MHDQGVIKENQAYKIFGEYQKGKTKIKELDLIPSVSLGFGLMLDSVWWGELV